MRTENNKNYQNFLITKLENHTSLMCVIYLQEVNNMKNIDELEAFLLKHGENIVDMMGAEIDRIEMKLRVSKYYISL